MMTEHANKLDTVFGFYYKSNIYFGALDSNYNLHIFEKGKGDDYYGDDKKKPFRYEEFSSSYSGRGNLSNSNRVSNDGRTRNLDEWIDGETLQRVQKYNSRGYTRYASNGSLRNKAK